MVIVCIHVNSSTLSFLSFLGGLKQSTTNQYEQERWMYQNILFILYTSGKLVIRVKNPCEEQIIIQLCKKYSLEINSNSSQSSSLSSSSSSSSFPFSNSSSTSSSLLFKDSLASVKWIVGSDETLKGDTFGGLVVVGALFSRDEEKRLIRLGVKDSKDLSDDLCRQIALQLLEIFPERFVIKNLFPKKYNQEQQKYSLTKLLNNLHVQVGNKLKECEPLARQVVDQYPGCQAGDVMVNKAESKYLAVAAASIVARHIAILQLQELSSRIGFIVPKGSTHVRDALKELAKRNVSKIDFVKLHFKNVK